jgi:hypothetical protein
VSAVRTGASDGAHAIIATERRAACCRPYKRQHTILALTRTAVGGVTEEVRRLGTESDRAVALQTEGPDRLHTEVHLGTAGGERDAAGLVLQKEDLGRR